MKRIFEWIGGFALIVFSFYFTDRVSLLVAGKSELMNEIKTVSKEYNEEAVDAIIDEENNTIIPGKYGRKVNTEESYLNMHDFGSFNENYLVFDYIKPKTSISNNKDKYITSGNSALRNVSIILEYNENIKNFFESERVSFDIIADENLKLENSEFIEYINGASIKENFKSLNREITDNKNICILNYSDEQLCKKNNYYIIKPQINLQSSNIVEVKNSLTSGSIILINANARLEDVKLLLNEIRYKDLNVVFVSELIKEENK